MLTLFQLFNFQERKYNRNCSIVYSPGNSGIQEKQTNKQTNKKQTLRVTESCANSGENNNYFS